MSYEVEHEKWLKRHLSRRKGKSLEALKRGHGYGNQKFTEYIWWRLFGHFKGLHPEFEILDWRGFPFYADFVWIVGNLRIVFEIQDFSSHVQNMDRTGYGRELNRMMFMLSLQYIVIPISLDELKNNPELVLSMVRTIIAPYLGRIDNSTDKTTFSKFQRDLMFVAVRNNRVLRPIDAARELGVSQETVIRHLKKLTQMSKFRAIPMGASMRVTSYECVGSMTDYIY